MKMITLASSVVSNPLPLSLKTHTHHHTTSTTSITSINTTTSTKAFKQSPYSQFLTTTYFKNAKK